MEMDDNAAMQHEMAMDNLQQALWDEKKPVSYKWLSHHMSIDANTAKRYLHSFATAHPSRVSILYYLSGCRPNDDTHHIEIIPQTLLEQTKTQYKTILSLHIYSLAPVKDGITSTSTPTETDVTPITEAIWASDMESLRQDYADNDVMRDNPLRDNRYGHVEHWGVTRSAKPRLADQPSPAKAPPARSDSGAAATKKAAAKPSFFGAKSTSSSSTSTSTTASTSTSTSTSSTSTSTSSSKDTAISSPKASAPVTSSSSPPSSASNKKKVVAPPKTGTLASMFGQQVQKAKQTSPTKVAAPTSKPTQTENPMPSSSSASSTTTSASSSNSTSVSSKPTSTTSKPTPTPSAPTSIFDDDEDDVMAVPDDDGEVEAVFTEVKPVKAEEAAAIKAKQEQAKREAEERARKEREAERKKREAEEREAAEKEKERKGAAAAAAAAATATTSPPAKESASKKRKSTSTKAKPAAKKKKSKSASSTKKKKKDDDDDDDDPFESDAEEVSEPEQVEEVVDDVEIEDIDMGDVDGDTRKSTIDAFLTTQAPITTPTHIRRKKIQKTTMDEKGWLITKEVWVDDDGNEIPDEVEQIKPKSVTTPSPKLSDMNKENEDAPNRVDDDDDDSGIVRTKIVQQTSRTVTDSGKKVKGKAVAVKKETYKVMTVEKVSSKKKKGNDEKGGKGKEKDKDKDKDKEKETDKSSKGGKKEKAAEPAPKAKSTLLGFFSKK